MMRRAAIAIALLVLGLAAPVARAHEVRPAYLELQQTAADAFDVMWKVPARGNRRLGLYVRLPESCTIVSEPRGLFRGGAYVERWSIVEPDALVGARIRIDGLDTMLTDVLVRIERLDGTTQVERLTPERPEFTVEAAPSLLHVSWTYFVLGVEHILFGIDHLLFVLALLVLVKGWKRVVGTITAFTVAHSITLALATLGFVHVPGPPVEAIIALSIVFVAGEIVHGRQGRPGLAERWPWTVAFIFGLLHGLGFAGALSEVGLPPQAIPLSLLFFNLGVEAGQLLFIFGVVAVITVVSALGLPVRAGWMSRGRRHPPYEILSAYAIGSIAMYWVVERVAAF